MRCSRHSPHITSTHDFLSQTMWLIKLCVISCLLSAACGSQWHLMFYFAADNDLDCYALEEVFSLASTMASLDSDGCRWSQCSSASDKCASGTTQQRTRQCKAEPQKVERLCCPEANFPQVWHGRIKQRIRGGKSCYISRFGYTSLGLIEIVF